jgi:hypothetical protein
LSTISRSGCAVDARGHNGLGQFRERGLGILVIDADTALHRDRNRHGGLHGRHAIADEPRLRHQAGAEAPLLHPVGRTADIQVDLIIAEVGRDAGTFGQRARIGAAKLQRHRMLRRIEAEQPLAVPVQDRARGHHLGIDQRPPGQQPVEEPAMPVRPIHHRGDRKPDM